MRRIHVVGAAVAMVAVLAVAVAAYAVPSSETTVDFSSTAKPKNAGTKKKPKATSVAINIDEATTSGQGAPQTTTDVTLKLPSTLKWFGGKWKNSKRCDGARAQNVVKSDSVCPRGSKVGSGTVIATSQEDLSQPKVTENFELTAYVLKGGDNPDPDPTQPRKVNAGSLGLWLEGDPFPVTLMLVGRVDRKNSRIRIHIPTTAQEPAPGTPFGIERLRFRLTGKTTVRRRVRGRTIRRTYGAVSSVGCKNRTWKTVASFAFRDGGKKSATDRSPCRK